LWIGFKQQHLIEAVQLSAYASNSDLEVVLCVISGGAVLFDQQSIPLLLCPSFVSFSASDGIGFVGGRSGGFGSPFDSVHSSNAMRPWRAFQGRVDT
jgi:hypothetical protein